MATITFAVPNETLGRLQILKEWTFWNNYSPDISSLDGQLIFIHKSKKLSKVITIVCLNTGLQFSFREGSDWVPNHKNEYSRFNETVTPKLSGQSIIIHQPRFPWKKGISLP